MKVKINDRMIFRKFLESVSIISAFFTIVFIFVDIPEQFKIRAGFFVAFIFLCLYIGLWGWYNKLEKISLIVEGSKVIVKAGDIFKQTGLKTIAFNEYFDTKVDDNIISRKSLNGIFIESHLDISLDELDNQINNNQFEEGELIHGNIQRLGKPKKYKLGTIFILDEYILVAFSKFDSKNKANLSMQEYLEFLINFWDNVNRVYSQKDVSVPIFGSGITRIKEHKSISDENLLKIMLWTFRISEMRFKHPAKLSIIIHEDKIDSVNLLDLKAAENEL